MGHFEDCCILFWNGGQKTVLFSTLTNVPTFFTTLSLHTYQTFVATFEATEAPFFQRETVLQGPERMLLTEDIEITLEEICGRRGFSSWQQERFFDDKVHKDNKMICTSNVPDPPDKMATPDKSIHQGPLTFDPSPPIAVHEDITLVTADDQAKLM